MSRKRSFLLFTVFGTVVATIFAMTAESGDFPMGSSELVVASTVFLVAQLPISQSATR